MRIANWDDYELIDASNYERLERWGDVILIRPDPQVIWNTDRINPLWKKPYAIYKRSSSGGGEWTVFKDTGTWKIKYKDLSFNLKLMGFKHTGIFPEQAVNWDLEQKLIRKKNTDFKVLNLFSYTGGATLACARSGASVCHVDASKGMVEWAKENAKTSLLQDKKIRWIVDDCVKFVKREIRRGKKYDAIIMDPPSYGRGPSKEIWRIEDSLYSFVSLTSELLSDDASFFMINSYTTGILPSVMEYILRTVICKRFSGTVFSDEIGLTVSSTGLALPCGSTAVWTS